MRKYLWPHTATRRALVFETGAGYLHRISLLSSSQCLFHAISAALQNLQVATELQVAEALLMLPGATCGATTTAAALAPSAKTSPVVSRASSTVLGSAPSTPATGRATAAAITPVKVSQQVGQLRAVKASCSYDTQLRSAAVPSA